MKVRELMTKDVFTMRADRRTIVASELMDWARIRHVPVVDEQGDLVGMLSHRDLLHASLSSVDKEATARDRSAHLASFPIAAAMHSGTLRVGPDADVREAAQLMRTHKIGALPVVEGRRLVGIISEADMLQLVAEPD